MLGLNNISDVQQYLNRKLHLKNSCNITFLSKTPSLNSFFVSRLRIDDYKFDLNERILWIQEMSYCDNDLDKEYTPCSINKK